MAKQTSDPFSTLRQVLNNLTETNDQLKNVRIDVSRFERTGIPETISAKYKPLPIVLENTKRLVEANGRVLVSQCSEETRKNMTKTFSKDYHVQTYEIAHIVIVHKKDSEPIKKGGTVGIISAGSSDIPVATEAALIATEMGAEVTTIWDVGVAGLHKVVKPLTQLTKDKTQAIVVAAGMDAALFTVVCGLVKIPVIGLPTSVGGGFAGGGMSALSAMLQSCAPGGAVVNIDNGIGAGILAARIANQSIKEL
jgi:NCAIR mutase (PurE)-related protein